MGIKKRMTELMKARNTNTNELAQKIGVPPTTLYSIMQRDSSRIDIDLIIKISHALGVTADELLTDELKELSEVSPVSHEVDSSEPGSTSEPPIDSLKSKLLDYYRMLNDSGRNELLKYAKYLVSDDDYRRLTPSEDVG